MKENGFTLVELIGIVAIIALVMLVTVPRVMSTITKSSTDKIESFERDMEKAASSYVEGNWSFFKSQYTTELEQKGKTKYCLSLQTLIDSGYVEKTQIDPSTNKLIDPAEKYILLEDISSSTNSYKFSYEYVDVKINANSECSDWEA